MEHPEYKNWLFLICIDYSSTISCSLFLFVGIPFNINSDFDRNNQQNDKIVNMLNTAIEKQINEHTQSTMHKGFISESRQNTIDYLKLIKTIETYAQHGAASTEPRNYI